MSSSRLLGFTTAGLSGMAAAYFFLNHAPPASWLLAGLFGGLAGYAVAMTVRVERRPVVQLKGLTWTREDFCRGWLITGDTGSGKTRSGITPLLYQVFKNKPTGAGCALMTRASTGKPSPRWPTTSTGKTI